MIEPNTPIIVPNNKVITTPVPRSKLLFSQPPLITEISFSFNSIIFIQSPTLKVKINFLTD